MSTANQPKDDKGSPGADQAIELLRQKIGKLYAEEPSAIEEIEEVKHLEHRRSKHQQYMYELSTSGKSLAEIQVAWHAYYNALPNDEKHQVWQEFYREHDHSHKSQQSKATPAPASPSPAQDSPAPPTSTKPASSDKRTVNVIRQRLLHHVDAQSKKDAKSGRGSSILFGLGAGGLVMLVMLFSFFNERIIAPFIMPSRSVSNAPLVIDPGNTTAGPEPKLFIPKINVDLPVVYDEPSIEEKNVQNALERGVLHYATTPSPGEQGNAVIFGHSSNNILNQGKYKFAFVLLKRLEIGDTFSVQKDSKRYVYRVYEKKVVKPSEVGVLNNTGKAASMTLITCDPPGTSLNRLVVIGEQISPDPATNIASKVNTSTAAQPAELPSASESLWQRFTNWLTS